MVYEYVYTDGFMGKRLEGVKPDTLVYEKGSNPYELKISVWNENKK